MSEYWQVKFLVRSSMGLQNQINFPKNGKGISFKIYLTLIRQLKHMTDSIAISHEFQMKNDSIKEVVEEYGSRLFNFIRNRVEDVEDARDILQDVYFEFTETSRMDTTIEQVASWLFRVARNKIIDKYRKKKTERLDEIKLNKDANEAEHLFLSEIIESENENPEAQYDNSLLMLAIEEALNELPIEQREVFVMHELESKSFKEISTATGASINTLLSRKRYAILHLRKKLTNLYNEIIN